MYTSSPIDQSGLLQQFQTREKLLEDSKDLISELQLQLVHQVCFI